MSNTGQRPLPVDGGVHEGRITRTSYPCPHCLMTFTCDAHRGRHIQASHASRNRLVGTSLEPSRRNLSFPVGASAAESDEPFVVDSDEPPAGYAGAGAVCGIQVVEDDEEPPAATRAVGGAGKLTLSGPCVGADGMERGLIGQSAAKQSTTGGDDGRMVAEYMSIASRIREYYNDMPEASQAVPVVEPECIDHKPRFSTRALRHELAFSLTSGECGMSERDHLALAHVLFDIEAAATVGSRAEVFTATFPTANSFLTETKHEQRRVLALRQWMHVQIIVGERTFDFPFRDALDAGLEALKTATLVSFGPDQRQALDGDGMSQLPSGDSPPPAWGVAGHGEPSRGPSSADGAIGGRSNDGSHASVSRGRPPRSGVDTGAASGSRGSPDMGGTSGETDKDIMHGATLSKKHLKDRYWLHSNGGKERPCGGRGNPCCSKCPRRAASAIPAAAGDNTAEFAAAALAASRHPGLRPLLQRCKRRQAHLRRGHPCYGRPASRRRGARFVVGCLSYLSCASPVRERARWRGRLNDHWVHRACSQGG